MVLRQWCKRLVWGLALINMLFFFSTCASCLFQCITGKLLSTQCLIMSSSRWISEGTRLGLETLGQSSYSASSWSQHSGRLFYMNLWVAKRLHKTAGMAMAHWKLFSSDSSVHHNESVSLFGFILIRSSSS